MPPCHQWCCVLNPHQLFPPYSVTVHTVSAWQRQASASSAKSALWNLWNVPREDSWCLTVGFWMHFFSRHRTRCFWWSCCSVADFISHRDNKQSSGSAFLCHIRSWVTAFLQALKVLVLRALNVFQSCSSPEPELSFLLFTPSTSCCRSAVEACV